jgi:SAM-dependent methyltransferase
MQEKKLVEPVTAPAGSCHICGSPSLKPFLPANGYLLAECGVCSHIQVDPIPDEKELVAMYKNVTDDSFYGNGYSVQIMEKYAHDKGFLRRFFSERIDVLDNLSISKDAVILDFGCTNGAFVRALADSGFKNPTGYDIAEDLVNEGRSNGLNLHTGDLAELASKQAGAVDLVMSYNVFEHLPFPKDALSNLARMVKPNGTVVLSVPYIHSLQGKLMKAKSPIVDPPYHIHYFTRKSFFKMFEDCGLTVVSSSTPFWTKLTDVYLTMKGMPASMAFTMRMMAIPLSGLMNLFSLGGTLLVIAKKKQ